MSGHRRLGYAWLRGKLHLGKAVSSGPKYFVHDAALVETEDIGERTRIWAFAHLLAGACVGADCNIGDHAFIEGGARLGNHVTVKNGVSVWSGVTVEDRCFLGPNCVFTNDLNPRAYLKKEASSLVPTVVKTGASIGANATIVCGHSIGRYAFVGAGAVVIRDVPDYALVVGNPARHSGWMCECATKLALPAAGAVGDTCTCRHCGITYVRGASGLARQPAGIAKREGTR